MSHRLEFPAPVGDDFQVLVTEAGEGRLHVRCTGTIDHTDASTAVQPQLMKLHEQLLKDGITRVDVDFHAVEYMNSSGLKGFIAWFLAAEFSNGGARYQVHIVYDPKKTWQSVSLTVMEKVAPRTVQVRTTSEAA